MRGRLPSLDPAFGTEFVRINLDAMLRQRQPVDRKDRKPSWRDQIRQVFLPRLTGVTPPERALIEHGLKWWPTKRYEDDFGDGVGESTEWRLEVESVVRAEFPAEGVPFSLILTIEDPDQSHPIFQELDANWSPTAWNCTTSRRRCGYVRKDAADSACKRNSHK